MAARPWFVLVAGINGAGKSTFTQSPEVLGGLVEDLGRTVQVINPDLVTRELRASDPKLSLDDANRAAADECQRRLDLVLGAARETIAIETVLSTDKYKPVFERAKTKGYRILFIYVVLDSVEEAIRRVRHRVGQGGHDVPEAKIRARWPRSLANLPWFWSQATRSFVFFNGKAAGPVLIAERSPERTGFNPASLSELLCR